MTYAPDWSTACPDWQAKIVKKQSLIPCKPLFPQEAEIALRVFKELTLVDVIDSPKIGEVTREWVYEFVASIFGAYDPDSKRRLIREFFLLISKKNTKSTIAAGIMLTALILNDRQSAEFIILAPTKEIADNSFIPVRDMINAEPDLKRMINVSEHTRTVRHLGTNATLKVVAADSDTVGGKKATGILVDELWIFGKRSNAESMMREATGGLASRPEGFVIYLTTQSDEPPAGFMKQKLDYARDIRDGNKVNPQFLPLLYEFPPGMLEAGEHLNPDNFYVTNPNLGASVDKDFLLNQLAQAKDAGEESLRDFLAKHLNVQIGMHLRANRWAGAEFWPKQASKTKLTIEKIIKSSDVITLGIDGGGLDDLLGFSVVGRKTENRNKWLSWSHAWCNEIVLERRKSEAPKLLDFQKAGELTIVERPGDDIAQLAEIAYGVFKSGKLNKIGLDPLGIGGLIDALLAVGIPQELLIGVQQGYKLAGYILTTERKLAEGNLVHADQALMTWCAGNARVVMRGNGMMITKQESGTAKIDPLIALFNAAALMSMNPEPTNKNYDVFFV